jgi:hypothetical protein
MAGEADAMRLESGARLDDKLEVQRLYFEPLACFSNQQDVQKERTLAEFISAQSIDSKWSEKFLNVSRRKLG